MQVMRSFESLIAAQQAAMYLRQNGVAAGLSVTGGGMLAQGVGVFIVEDSQADQARALLKRMAEEPIELASDWEQEATPDLSRLPEECVPRCGSCRGVLARDASVQRCPTCGESVDVAALVADQYGPEALEDCVAEAEERDDKPGGLLAGALPLLCSCGYSLAGLAEAGKCPECGSGYDKARMVREILRQGGMG